jgi:hypothetical protein
MKPAPIKATSKPGPKPKAKVDKITTVPPEERPHKFTAFDLFDKCIERARNLLKIHAQAHGKQAKPERHLADCHRAAIVLSIAALDAYVRALVLNRITELLIDSGRELPAPLTARIKNFLNNDALLEAARKDDLVERVEKAFKNDFEKKSFQGLDVISEALELIGHSNVFHEIAIHKKLNEDTLRKELTHYTMRRHTIAHRGDYDLTQIPPKELTVTKAEAEACIKLVDNIASGLNFICTH